MISRYTIPDMQIIWSDENRFFKYSVFHHAYLTELLKRPVVLTELDPDYEKIKQFEAQTHHEMQASLLEFETRIDPDDLEAKANIHKNLTSSDVIDTVLAEIIKQASNLLKAKIADCFDVMQKLVDDTNHIYTIGRTHGRHAIPMKMSSRFKRELHDIHLVATSLRENCDIPGKLSGPVGELGYDHKLINGLNVQFNLVNYMTNGFSGQCVSRHYHSKIIYDIALLGTLVERLVTNIRLLSMNEIDELSEGFSENQAGSSSMPHKKNPIRCENLVGIARLLRSYVTPSLENVPLWLERDMTHSSVERVILPDSFNLIYYMFTKLEEILTNLSINKTSIERNLRNYEGSSYNELNNSKLPRSEAYNLIKDKYHGT